MSKCLHHSKLSLYADDSKVFMHVKDKAYCVNLQCDITRVVKWTNNWKLTLNYAKCSMISFTKKRTTITFPYRFDKRTTISRTHCVKDLGVFLTSKLHWGIHINHIVTKAFKMLGFVKRTCKNFNSNNVLITLYVSLIRSNLEYCSQVWSPHQRYLIEKLERVQKKFIKHLCYRSSQPYSNEMYNSLCKKISAAYIGEQTGIFRYYISVQNCKFLL